MRIKHLFLCVVVLVFAVGVAAQEQSKPQPDRWRGLVLDVATPDDAIAGLGKPSKDKTATKKGVALRTLEFKKPAGFDKAHLQFADGKLSTIILVSPKEAIPADNLPSIYGLEFDVRVSGLSEAFEPGNVERNQGKTYPKSFPTVYSLYASTGNSQIEVTIGNSSFGSIMKKSLGVTDGAGIFPGKVIAVTLKSVTLNKTQGADALK